MTLIGALIVGALLAFVCQLTLVYAQDSSGKRIQLHSQNITTLPFGERQFSGGQWAEIANGRCLLCHSRGMIDTQPPMPLAAWKGEIAKMRSAYGCNMNDDEVDGLAQFMYDHNHAIGSASR
jgi:hypothetical protein